VTASHGLSDYDPLDPAYRWCVYCGADCWPEPECQQHRESCPAVTGLYLVRDADLVPHGFGCCRCPVTFWVGDRYVLIGLGTARPATGPELGEVVCVGCGAAALVA